jgi:nucleotide-binding universal stress UspA family protein
MTPLGQVSFATAINDFRRARRRAAIERVLTRFTRKPADLLPYEEVKQKLHAVERTGQNLQDIPLDSIVGSVGRYSDFSRSFLPRQNSDEERWARVKVAVSDDIGLPPIEVYKLGEAYFVRDGNHRVSIARQQDQSHIQAYVTEVQSKVSLSPDDSPDNLILKAELAEFLEQTRIHSLFPEADLTVTAPGGYRRLENYITVHQYYMELEQERDVPYEEAVSNWYETEYMPIVDAIRNRGILRDFPKRTETDLYLWVSDHRRALMRELGWQVSPEAAASDLASRFSPKPAQVASRLGHKVQDVVTPDELEAGPAPGQWREEHLAAREGGSLFSDLLVPLSGEDVGWAAFEQAVIVAQREDAQLFGLHVVPSKEQLESEATQAVREEFEKRCLKLGLSGNLKLETGEVSRKISELSRLSDLVAVNLAYPPGSKALTRLSSGFRTMLRRCARPVLATPGVVSPLSRAILAYDGSPKAEEALFVATYLAGKWDIALVVITVEDAGINVSRTLKRAKDYLEEHGVQAEFVAMDGKVASVILDAVGDYNCDLIVMGGYGHSPVLEVVLGSSMDQVLRESRTPMLICR